MLYFKKSNVSTNSDKLRFEVKSEEGDVLLEFVTS